MNILKPEGEETPYLNPARTLPVILEELTYNLLNVVEEVNGFDSRVHTYALTGPNIIQMQVITEFLSSLLELTKGNDIVLRRPLELQHWDNNVTISIRIGIL